MDPLSIAMAASSAIACLAKVSNKTYAFAQDAKVVNKVLLDLRSEFASTTVVLETIKTALRKPQHILLSRAEDSSAFLPIVEATIRECQDMAEDAQQLLQNVDNGITYNSVVARSIRQGRFMYRKPALRDIQRRFEAQKKNLQLLLQMLNVYVVQIVDGSILIGAVGRLRITQ